MASHHLTSRLSFVPKPLPSAFPNLNRRRIHSSIIRMSSNTIEHVVLLKLKPQTQPDAMLTNLNNLKSLNQVLHLTAGQIHKTATTTTIPTFTHMLHSRYASKSDLSTYSSHPDHLHAVRTSVLPICDDIMAVDWISHSPSLNPIILPPKSAIRFTFLKLKPEISESEKMEVIEVVKASKKAFVKILQSSVGENFSHERAKGFTIASLAVYPTLKDLEDAVEDETRVLEEEKMKLAKFVDDVIKADYVVPSH